MLNLFNILLENINIEKLIEEGKDPVELLHYKFQNIPDKIIDKVISIDPTKKKSYSQWLLSKWDKEENRIVKNLENGRIEQLFQFFKEHQEKQIKQCPSVEEGLDAYVPKVQDTVLDKSDEPQTYLINIGGYVPSKLANDFDIIFNEDNWLIAVPNTYEASCKLGENCWWCTANHYGNGESYYDQYLKEGGKYYINFDLTKGETLDDKTKKEYPYTRYQFHFESHQFKAATKGEPDVTPDDIGMPESAIDFYRDHEDKDMDDFMSEEEKWERYSEDRWQDNIRLNDDLYLNVEFDDSFEYHEPSLESDWWYIFDNEDDRDPISYDGVDPNIETSLLVNNDEVIIIKSNNEDSYELVVKGASENRWRDWGAYQIGKYVFVDGFDNVLFAYVGKSYSTSSIYFFRGGYKPYTLDFAYKKAENENTNFFINQNFKNYENTYAFLEIVLPDGYHSLAFATDDEFEYIIRKDIPANGQYYELTEDNIIKGEFRDYDLDELFNDVNSQEYHLEQKLPNGNYLVVTQEVHKDKYGDKKENESFNVLDNKTKELIFDTWAKFIYYTDYGYILTFDDGCKLYNFDGQLAINKPYSKITKLTEDSDIICGSVLGGGYDLIDGKTKQIFQEFSEIDLYNKPENGKIVVYVQDKETGDTLRKIYDYQKRQFVYNQYEYIEVTSRGLVIGRLPNDNGYQVFNYKTNKMLFDNVLDVKTDKIFKRIHIELKDGKKNCIASNSDIIMAPVNYDIFVNEHYDIINYANEGKYFLYNYKEKNFLLNPNGLNVHGFFHMYGTINFEVPNSSMVVGYLVDGNGFRYKEHGTYKTDVKYDGRNVDENAPIEVQNFVNYLMTGTNQQLKPSVSQAEQVPSVAEDFKRMLNRINEARKLNYREMIF